MAKQNKTPLSLKASSGASFLKGRGFEVPSSVVAEMLARLEGFGCYAAYKASLEPKAPSPIKPLTHKLRLVYEANMDRGQDWFVAPVELKDFYAADNAQDVLDALRETTVLDNLEQMDGLLLNLSDIASDSNPVQISKVFSICPSISSYGVPPTAWLLVAPNLTGPVPVGDDGIMRTMEQITDIYDMGDDSGGYLILEVNVSEETWQQAQDLQRAMYRATAQDIVGEIRSKGAEYGFSYNDLERLVRENYADEFVDLPGFFEQVRSV